MNDPQTPMTDQPPVKKQRGCLFYGSLGCLGIIIFVGGLIGFWSWKIMKSISPHEIEKVTLNPQEQETFDTKVNTLQRGKGGGGAPVSSAAPQPTQPVTFSSREISALLSNLDFGNQLFQVQFSNDSIRVMANLPIPKELPGLEGEEAENFSNILSAVPLGQQIPLNAEVRLILKEGKPYLHLMSADMMGMPLSVLFGPNFQAGQELDILGKFGKDVPVLERILGHLAQLKFDEKGLHLTPR